MSSSDDRPGPRHTNEIDRRLGELLRDERRRQGLSQEDLSSALGISFQQVQKYEKGTNRVSASRLQQIAAVLGVPVASFFAPGASNHSPTPPAEGVVEITSLPSRREEGELLSSFRAIRDPAVRAHVLTLVATLAKGASGGS